MGRLAHLVGSIPAGDAGEAMGLALDLLGPHLRWLPDGETGRRSNWIVHIIESLRHHPDLELARDGYWTDYEDTPRFRLRSGHTLDGATLDLGHVDAFAASYPEFRRLRDERDRDGLAFQVGLPSALDLALFSFGPAGAWRQRGAFADALAREIEAIHERAGDDVVFQLEAPAELVLLARLPEPAQRLAAPRLAQGLLDLAARAPEAARFGVHLCLGDMNHRALGRLRNASPLVHLANALAARWPSGRPLEFVHTPLAAADEPPANRVSFYAPLARLELDPATAFVAGFVHEDHPLQAQEALRDHLDGLIGREVGVATSCGLGRRDRGAAVATMERAAALCA